MTLKIYPKNKCRTIGEPFVEFDFDFENGIAKGYIAYPTLEEIEKNIAIDDAERKREEILCKKFQIPENYKSIKFEGLHTYIFPKFYSIENLKQHDKEYWSIVFESIFKNEIVQVLKKRQNIWKTQWNIITINKFAL